MTHIRCSVSISLAIALFSICYSLSAAAYDFKPQPPGSVMPQSGKEWWKWDLKMKEIQEKAKRMGQMFVVSVGDDDGDGNAEVR